MCNYLQQKPFSCDARTQIFSNFMSDLLTVFVAWASGGIIFVSHPHMYIKLLNACKFGLKATLNMIKFSVIKILECSKKIFGWKLFLFMWAYG